ncbi:GGDEF domain-containing protein [Radiobacillus kanasensis]|uniref:sensor domain-containing diguanylate cyclase n=1 Tax=Radiobacillus kanasensis TaxID=2844358 RepID=UPI001E32F1E7|nr:sensor domain-containing diguanylate cyclase [Radiobacillus kanasensis]UFT99664.1 GGDEF domain-containing protein [Radiobacillus kanasensis]
MDFYKQKFDKFGIEILADRSNLEITNFFSDLVFVMKVEQRAFYYYFMNESAQEHTNLSEDSYGKKLQDVLPEKETERIQKEYEECVSRRNLHVYEDYFLIGKNKIYSHTVLTPILDDRNVCQYVIGVTRNISEKKEYENQLLNLAYYDDLTNVYNRRGFTQALKEEIEKAKAHNQFLAVMFLDGDNFKLVNDTYGHEYGDRLLKMMAHRLVQHSKTNLVARIGGDEFAILLTSLSNIIDLNNFCEELIEQFNQDFIIQNQTTKLTLSIGAAIYPNHGEDPADLLRNADRALYMTKRSGKNNFQIYD